MGTEASDSAEKEWRATHRFAFRFAFAYFVLYSFPFPKGSSGTTWLTDAYAGMWNHVAAWVGTRVLHLGQTISTVETGSGDRVCNYVQLLCTVVLAALVTIVWSVVDARRKEYRRLHEWLRVYLRYVLAFTMLMYGVVKMLGGQFFPPSILRLNETYGQTSRQTLLWTFMGASATYTFFAGAMETTSAASCSTFARPRRSAR